jgi:DNA modification methylase
MSEFTVLEGDCLSVLATLDAASVQTCITSPPYYGLRDYGHDGQIGLEQTPEQYVEKLVEVFREVRRVLRDDGTLWLNLGDSYASAPGANNGNLAEYAKTQRGGGHRAGDLDTPRRNVPAGYKPKDLLGIPWMVAFALRADGWYLRSDIIWAKPNPMPESVTDRPTKAHEYLFLLSKGPRYYYDADAVREPYDVPPHAPGNKKLDASRNDQDRMTATWGHAAGRNKRSVWTVATQPFPGAHFATFPPKLIEPCVLAGSSPQACAECGAPWERVVEVERSERTDGGTPQARVDGAEARHRRLGSSSVFATNELPTKRTTSWRRTCHHDDRTATGGKHYGCMGHGRSTVLDPFNGAGTTGVVALRHDRDYIGIELNAEYAQMARDRIYDDGPLLNVERAA